MSVAAPRQMPVAIKPVTASIAAVCTPSAASASASEPDAPISLTDASPKQSGISAGTSINPAPCAVDIMKDQSASPACSAGARIHRGVRHER
jgi:hypothetical protein